jgi:hypothetical protein
VQLNPKPIIISHANPLPRSEGSINKAQINKMEHEGEGKTPAMRPIAPSNRERVQDSWADINDIYIMQFYKH